jgi:transposase
MTIETLGVDIAKNVFQLHGVNRNGHVVLKRRVMRDQLLSTLTQIERCTVVIEACTGAFYWARKFEAFGHEVKIISPQYVKPFVRRQKNDGNDAEAICTAARQPHIPFVPKKTIEQQDIQALHRARQRMVNHRTAVVSQIRGLLLDRGFAIAKSITRARRVIPEILSDLENELTGMVREALAELYDLFRDLDRRIGLFDKKIDLVFRENEDCQRIASQGRRPENSHGDCRRHWRRVRVQEWAASSSLGRARSAAAFERRSQGADGHFETRKPTPAQPSRSRRTRCRANGAK